MTTFNTRESNITNVHTVSTITDIKLVGIRCISSRHDYTEEEVTLSSCKIGEHSNIFVKLAKYTNAKALDEAKAEAERVEADWMWSEDNRDYFLDNYDDMSDFEF